MGLQQIFMNTPFKKLDKKKLDYDLSNSIIIHGGGWKKLSYLNISKKKFEKLIYDKYKIKKIFNYYGMNKLVQFSFNAKSVDTTQRTIIQK